MTTSGTAPRTTPALVRRVRRGLDDAGVVLAGRRVLAMCSGGVDSVTLVDVLASLPRGARPAAVVVAFLDHGLRDVAADRAAAAAVAEAHGLELVELAAELEPGGNLQARAREWRYVAAAGLAAEHRCDAITTGHTADDQLEGLLYGLVADGGSRSLAGMSSAGPTPGAPGTLLVRPLLCAARADVATHAEQGGLAWAEDPTNALRVYRRNALRHDVVPRLLDAHPGAGANLARLARRVSEQEEALEALARGLLDDPGDDLDVRRIEALPQAARGAAIACWLRDAGAGRAVSERTVAAIDRLVTAGSDSGFVQLSAACVRRDGYLLCFRSEPGSGSAPTDTPQEP